MQVKTGVERGMYAPISLARVTIRATVATVCLIGLTSCEERSSTTILEAEGAQIIFSVGWGWGMVQSVGVARHGRVASQQEEDVWKKPYNVGGPVYVDGAGNNLYIVLFSGLYRVDIGAAKVTNVCLLPEKMASSLTYIGQLSLRDMQSSGRGDGVAFSPAGTSPPAPSGVKPELASLTKGRCG